MANTIQTVKVKNLKSASGNNVPNQFEIRTPDGVYFQSYRTIIAAVIKGKVYLHNGGNCGYDWQASRTTGKYRNIFLGETLAETRRKVKSGEYTETNLN